ncbi:unnamed protein product [Amoebophrya sp. A120]|nr:unnamed protein product [Amoebophrya sp. A120]|eukprot:GSA120T00001722001.1
MLGRHDSDKIALPRQPRRDRRSSSFYVLTSAGRSSFHHAFSVATDLLDRAEWYFSAGHITQFMRNTYSTASARLFSSASQNQNVSSVQEHGLHTPDLVHEEQDDRLLSDDIENNLRLDLRGRPDERRFWSSTPADRSVRRNGHHGSCFATGNKTEELCEALLPKEHNEDNSSLLYRNAEETEQGTPSSARSYIFGGSTTANFQNKKYRGRGTNIPEDVSSKGASATRIGNAFFHNSLEKSKAWFASKLSTILSSPSSRSVAQAAAAAANSETEIRRFDSRASFFGAGESDNFQQEQAFDHQQSFRAASPGIMSRGNKSLLPFSSSGPQQPPHNLVVSAGQQPLQGAAVATNQDTIEAAEIQIATKTTDEARASPLRLIPRDNYSNGANIVRENRPMYLLNSDTFHVLLGLTVKELVSVFFATYIGLWVVFAGAIYYLVPNDACGLNVSCFVDAMYLSLETLTTIGYGVPDPYFNHCPHMICVLVCAHLLNLFSASAVIGTVLTKISKGQKRAATIMFSDVAVVEPMDGYLYFAFQLGELRKTTLIKTNVSCFLFKHNHASCTNLNRQTEALLRKTVAKQAERLEKMREDCRKSLETRAALEDRKSRERVEENNHYYASSEREPSHHELRLRTPVLLATPKTRTSEVVAKSSQSQGVVQPLDGDGFSYEVVEEQQNKTKLVDDVAAASSQALPTGSDHDPEAPGDLAVSGHDCVMETKEAASVSTSTNMPKMTVDNMEQQLISGCSAVASAGAADCTRFCSPARMPGQGYKTAAAGLYDGTSCEETTTLIPPEDDFVLLPELVDGTPEKYNYTSTTMRNCSLPPRTGAGGRAHDPDNQRKSGASLFPIRKKQTQESFATDGPLGEGDDEHARSDTRTVDGEDSSDGYMLDDALSLTPRVVDNEQDVVPALANSPAQPSNNGCPPGGAGVGGHEHVVKDDNNPNRCPEPRSSGDERTSSRDRANLEAGTAGCTTESLLPGQHQPHDRMLNQCATSSNCSVSDGQGSFSRILPLTEEFLWLFADTCPSAQRAKKPKKAIAPAALTPVRHHFSFADPLPELKALPTPSRPSRDRNLELPAVAGLEVVSQRLLMREAGAEAVGTTGEDGGLADVTSEVRAYHEVGDFLTSDQQQEHVLLNDADRETVTSETPALEVPEQTALPDGAIDGTGASARRPEAVLAESDEEEPLCKAKRHLQTEMTSSGEEQGHGNRATSSTELVPPPPLLLDVESEQEEEEERFFWESAILESTPTHVVLDIRGPENVPVRLRRSILHRVVDRFLQPAREAEDDLENPEPFAGLEDDPPEEEEEYLVKTPLAGWGSEEKVSSGGQTSVAEPTTSTRDETSNNVKADHAPETKVIGKSSANTGEDQDELDRTFIKATSVGGYSLSLYPPRSPQFGSCVPDLPATASSDAGILTIRRAETNQEAVCSSGEEPSPSATRGAEAVKRPAETSCSDEHVTEIAGAALRPEPISVLHLPPVIFSPRNKAPEELPRVLDPPTKLCEIHPPMHLESPAEKSPNDQLMATSAATPGVRKRKSNTSPRTTTGCNTNSQRQAQNIKAVKQSPPPPEAPAFSFQQYRMRLQNPSDREGAQVDLDLPQKIMHRIDQWSPLVPSAYREAMARIEDAFFFTCDDQRDPQQSLFTALGLPCCFPYEEPELLIPLDKNYDLSHTCVVGHQAAAPSVVLARGHDQGGQQADQVAEAAVASNPSEQGRQLTHDSGSALPQDSASNTVVKEEPSNTEHFGKTGATCVSLPDGSMRARSLDTATTREPQASRASKASGPSCPSVGPSTAPVVPPQKSLNPRPASEHVHTPALTINTVTSPASHHRPQNVYPPSTSNFLQGRFGGTTTAGLTSSSSTSTYRRLLSRNPGEHEISLRQELVGMRQVDAEMGMRCGKVCNVCGENLLTDHELFLHCLHNSTDAERLEAKRRFVDHKPQFATHGGLLLVLEFRLRHDIWKSDVLLEYLKDYLSLLAKSEEELQCIEVAEAEEELPAPGKDVAAAGPGFKCSAFDRNKDIVADGARAGTGSTLACHDHRRRRTSQSDIPGAITTTSAKALSVSPASCNYFEMVCILEGVEPLTSHPIQARYSYLPEEIVFGKSFGSCVRQQQSDDDQGLVIDYCDFQATTGTGAEV